MGVGRLAPSPTGGQHLGNARTYLLAYWSARRSESKLVLRIEDVDLPRVKPGAILQAIDDLRWLGIDWDEGPDVGGPSAPYIQTERVDRYDEALSRLIQQNQVFPCTCSRKDIALAGSAPHFEHEGPVYSGTCAGWQSGDRIPMAGTFCWRFRAGHQPVEFDDLVLGPQRCVPAVDLGAFPVTQKSGKPAYQLAVVVDDAEMGITEVVRGDDLVPSTFRQIQLYHALGHQPPTFAHVPLVMGQDGRRLAKRHGGIQLSQLRESGLPSQQIVSWAAQSAGMVDSAVDSYAGQPRQPCDWVESFSWDNLPRQQVVIERFW